jgi:phosphohistidine phosphatase SixA
MQRFSTFRFFVQAAYVVLTTLTGLQIAQAQELTDLNFLKQGGYTLIFRHADADVGMDTNGDVASLWWSQCNSTVSRQLNTLGRTNALTIGRGLKKLAPVSRVMSSEYCRCYETAILMNLGRPIELSTTLTMVVYPGSTVGSRLNELAAPVPPSGTNTVLVTHGISWADTLYDRVGSLAWSDAAVYQTKPNARPDFVGFIRIATWNKLTSVQLAQVRVEDIRLEAAPNPISGNKLHISLDRTCTVKVVNALGQMLLSETRTAGVSEFDTSLWPAGAYQVLCTDGVKTSSKQVMRVK